MGLYAAAQRGVSHYSDDTVGFAPIIEQGTCIVGSIFAFRGIPFIFSLIEEHLSGHPAFIKLPNWENAFTSYHLPLIRFEVDGFLSQSLAFHW